VLELVAVPAPDDPPEPDPLVDVAGADALDPAAAPTPEPPPEEAPVVRLPDPEAAGEDAVPAAGKLTAP
jgi:hypothetical protein